MNTLGKQVLFPYLSLSNKAATEVRIAPTYATRLVAGFLQHLSRMDYGRSQRRELFLGAGGVAGINGLVHSRNYYRGVAGIFAGSINGVFEPGTVGQSLRQQ